MAATRDQAARAFRPDAGDAGRASSSPGDVRRGPVAEESRPQSPEVPNAPPVTQPAGTPSAPAAEAPKSGRRKFTAMGIVALLALAAAGYAVYYAFAGRFYISTDDAYVRANNTMLGARVAGHITAIVPADNSIVRKGDVIFRIDDGDYRIAVDSARSRIATQQATIERIGRQITALESTVEQSRAQLVSAEAALKRAGLDFERQQALSTKGFASRATFEVSEASRDQGAAAVKSAQAAYDAARDNVEVTKAQQNEARAQLAELQSALAKAERDLEFTFVRAPVEGLFSNRLVNVGDMIQAGQRLGNVVPLDEVFIDANYKETQLKRIRPGQPVTIKVDAYGFRKFKGVVDSISAGAGSVFTLLPPDNATGNFTKIVQRVPVRIRVPRSVARQHLLRAGMSVYTTVDTREGAHDADNETDLDSPEMTQPK